MKDMTIPEKLGIEQRYQRKIKVINILTSEC